MLSISICPADVQVEKLNNAMKEGVLRMIMDEEGDTSATSTPGKPVNFTPRSSVSPATGSSGLSDYLSFALSCATGYQDSAAQDSSEIRWNPSSPPAASASGAHGRGGRR